MRVTQSQFGPEASFTEDTHIRGIEVKRHVSKVLAVVSFLFLSIVFHNSILLGTEIIRSGVSPTNPDGLSAQISQLVAEMIGGKLEMKNYPFKRRLLMMKRGELDFMVGLFKRPEREQYIYFLSKPYIKRVTQVFFVEKGNQSKIAKYEDLYRFTIGTTAGAKYFLKFDNDSNIRKKSVRKLSSIFKMLIKNRVDAVICNRMSGISTTKNLGIADKVEIAEYHHSKYNPIYIGISKRSPLMGKINTIEQTINNALDSGQIEEVINQFYSDNNSR